MGESGARYAPEHTSFVRKHKSGRYYRPGHTVTAQGPGQNYQYWEELIVPTGETWDRIGVEVTTLAAASTVRLGAYSAAADEDRPDARLFDAGTVDSTTTGVKEIVISQAVPAGRLYPSAICQGGAPSLRCNNWGNAAVGAFTLAEAINGSNAGNGWYQAGQAGAMAANAVPVGSTGFTPIVAVRVA